MKIDTSKIENFENLTADELRKVIQETEVDNGEFAKLKAAFNKASSDLAAAKKQITATQTEDERKAAEQAELFEQLKAENAELKKSALLADTTKKFLSLGMDEQTATAAATAQVNGDTSAVFESLANFKDSLIKNTQVSMAQNAPTPTSAGAGTTAKTKAEIMQIKDTAERQAAIAENPDLFGI